MCLQFCHTIDVYAPSKEQARAQFTEAALSVTDTEAKVRGGLLQIEVGGLTIRFREASK